MRRGFTQQLAINIIPIEEVEVPKVKRDHMANLLSALQHLYSNKEWSSKVEAILGSKINTGKRATGRTGMSLWEIFVLAQVRLCMNISYDTLLNQANFHTLLRGILGVQPNDYTAGYQYSRQNIIDNVSLLDDKTIKQINDLIVEMGHDVFKKKETTALSTKVDSFVVETETYFPTDYRLLYDSARKCLEIIGKLNKKHKFGSGWRQWKDTRKKLKSLYRAFGRATSGGGKNKETREQLACTNYLKPSRELYKKVTTFLDQQAPLLFENKAALAAIMELEWYKTMLEKHIDLLERRIIKREVIPHSEKIFSIFLPFAEFINKGKKNPSVEIGKMFFVTTDQYNLIIDYQQGEQLKDKDAIIGILDRIVQKYSLASLSTDKGFSTIANRALIKEVYPEIELVMPKKGKRNQEEEKEEKSKSFKKLNNAHSAIESNINELENRGLDRCPDRSAKNFSKYLGLAVCAYNLHKIGKELISIQVEKDKKQRRKLARAA